VMAAFDSVRMEGCSPTAMQKPSASPEGLFRELTVVSGAMRGPDNARLLESPPISLVANTATLTCPVDVPPYIRLGLRTQTDAGERAGCGSGPSRKSDESNASLLTIDHHDTREGAHDRKVWRPVSFFQRLLRLRRPHRKSNTRRVGQRRNLPGATLFERPRRCMCKTLPAARGVKYS
jgi:hypothetical protein